MTLDRLKKQETHIKSEHEEFEFEKNDGYQSEKSRHTLKQQQLRLSEIQEQLKQLENDIEVYSKLSKEGKENVSQVEKELNQNVLMLQSLKKNKSSNYVIGKNR